MGISSYGEHQVIVNSRDEELKQIRHEKIRYRLVIWYQLIGLLLRFRVISWR